MESSSSKCKNQPYNVAICTIVEGVGLEFRIPHSPQNTRKIASSLLERDFFIVFCNAPRRAGRDVQRSEATAQIPESEGCAYCDSSGLSPCKGPAASGKGCRNKVTKSLLKKQLDRILDQILHHLIR